MAASFDGRRQASKSTLARLSAQVPSLSLLALVLALMVSVLVALALSFWPVLRGWALALLRCCC
jgi:hypothetical protein